MIICARIRDLPTYAIESGRARVLRSRLAKRSTSAGAGGSFWMPRASTRLSKVSSGGIALGTTSSTDSPGRTRHSDPNICFSNFSSGVSAVFRTTSPSGSPCDPYNVGTSGDVLRTSHPPRNPRLTASSRPLFRAGFTLPGLRTFFFDSGSARRKSQVGAGRIPSNKKSLSPGHPAGR
jgi:hypothetical protein